MNDTNTAPARQDRPARQVTRIPLIPPPPRMKRVAAYARVSADKDASLHSLAAQISHYTSLIQSRKDWVFAGVYADEGISGTKENRPEFQRLLTDCREGKIDLVLVKSVSRFARNTLTSLETVRELKSMGIDVFFEKENCHSMDGRGELLLTLVCAFAQAEAQSASENSAWRIRKNFEAGIPVTNRIYGFRMKKGRFCVVPEEARIIREVFSMYLDGLGRTAIATRLNERGVPSPDGGQWAPYRLYVILRNEKYAGDLLMQKCYVSDYLTKKVVKNHGERNQFFIEHNHEAIIPRQVFDQVQAEIERRADKYSPLKGSQDGQEDPDGTAPVKRADGKYLFTGVITCGVCGRPFCRKKTNAGTPYAAASWACSGYAALGKKACASRRVPEKALIPIAAELLDADEEALPVEISRINSMTIFPDGRLEATIDGMLRTAAWGNISRRESWDEGRRKRASAKMKENWNRRNAK